MNYLEEVSALRDSILKIRHDIHRHPEVGTREYHTVAYVESVLRSLSIPTYRVADTGVMGVLEFSKPGITVALRADLDALPVEEQTDAAFQSEVSGVMHACGHDVHTAAALGAAMLLKRHEEELCGTVRFLFQPDEEGDGGAERLISEGCMEGVSCVFGAHVAPDLPLGTVGVRYGKFYAAADKLDITVHGVSCHGATPDQGKSALLAACEMILRLSDLPKQYPGERMALSIGCLKSGTVRNIIPDKAEFSGILRTLGPERRTELQKRIREVLTETAAEHGVTVDIGITEGYYGVVNSDHETEVLERALKELLGAERVTRISEPVMTTEDMGYLIREASGSFYHIGAGCSYPLHHPCFLPSDDAVLTAAACHAAALTAALRK